MTLKYPLPVMLDTVWIQQPLDLALQQSVCLQETGVTLLHVVT